MNCRNPFVVLWASALSIGFCGQRSEGGTALGDWGHFLSFAPKIHLNNPDGKPFTLTIHLMRWTFPGHWNVDAVPLRLTGPGKKVILEGTFRVEGTGRQFDVPAGAKGVYLLEANTREGGRPQWVNFWVESSLDQSVVWTGDPRGHAIEGRRLVTQCSVPRRYWFWVPPRTSEFTCRAQYADRYMSQREDWGITIFSPRGQRIRRLWGETPREAGYQDMVARVPVEPGAAGRFWSVEIRHADSHNYSNINFSLEGVPPYLARSPEEWFNPATGKAPGIDPYDHSKFMQESRDKKVKLQHWSPCPSLGDPDGVQVRGKGRLALWNPHNRELTLGLGNYLPRGGLAEAVPASVKITAPRGKALFDGKVLLKHRKDGLQSIPAAGKGVYRVAVSGIERWYAYTYPATPLVWVGDDAGDGWRRFRFEVGTARNWCFFVPRGTKSFAVRAAAQHETDVMHVEINAPDRTMAMIYNRKGERTIQAPNGLDGKIWHLRTDIGSSTRMVTHPGRQTRYLGIYLTLDLKGVPGYLAPTWEQWFDPDRPVAPAHRGRPEM